MKLDNRVNTLQKSLKWFKDEAMNLSKIVENKNHQIKQVQNEYALVKNEIAILTQGLKNAKKEALIAKTAMSKQQKLVVDLISIIRKSSKKQFKDEDLKNKVQEIETQMLDMEFNDEDPMHRVIHDKDAKLLSNVISPVVKKGFEQPIDSQNIFH
jgi:CII-binding regulator of phage lambda lysogenization HflD